MKTKIYYIGALAAVCMTATGCDEQIMEWQSPDGTVKSSELPLEVREKLALYAPIREYMEQYHPETQIANGMSLDLFLENGAYRQLVLDNFNAVTFGNAMKHQSIVSASGKCNWDKVDQFIAMGTGLALHGHTLLWHTQQQQNYMKSLIAPVLVQENTGGKDGIANVLVGDASDFEGGTTGGWGSWGGNKESVEVVDGVGHDGSKGLVLKNKGDGNAWEAQCAFTFDNPLKEGVPYKISFWAKSDTGAGELQFQYQNGTTYGSQGGYNTFNIGTSWVKCEYEFTPAFDDSNRIILNFGKVGGTYIVDDIRFGEYSDVPADPMINVLAGDASDFEEGTAGGWGSWGGNKESAEVVDGAGADGSKGLVLKNKGDGNAWEAQCAYTFDVPLKQDVPYIIQFEAKSDSPAGQLQFQYQNGTTYGSQGGYNTFNIGTDWVTCEYEFTPAFDDSNRIILNFGAIGGTYVVDNIKFGEKVADASGAPRRAAFHYELKTADEKRAILLECMEAWIKEAMEHVGPYCTSWDVVNEPVDDSGRWRGFDGAFMSGDEEPDREPVETVQGGLELNWQNGVGNAHWYWGYFIGRDYAARAFEYAAKYNPNGAKLFVNDYNLETNPSKLAALIEFVNFIDQNGGHVDGIGTQMHVSKSLTRAQVDAMFKTMAATGKLVRVTELDVALGTSTPSAGELQTQSDIYQMICESYFENVPEAQRSGITVWGVSDKANEHEYWLKGDAPNIFDADYGRKTAYKGVCDGIAGQDLSETFNGDDWKKLVEE